MQERLIRLPEVTAMVALSRATIYRMVQAGTFPQPIKQGRTSAWPHSEVRAYLEQVIAQRDLPNSSR